MVSLPAPPSLIHLSWLRHSLVGVLAISPASAGLAAPPSRYFHAWAAWRGCLHACSCDNRLLAEWEGCGSVGQRCALVKPTSGLLLLPLLLLRGR